MHKIIVMTDIHLRGAGKTIIGLDPLARFDAALSEAVGAHPDAKALILMVSLIPVWTMQFLMQSKPSS